jgi:putative phage-type endonuclease
MNAENREGWLALRRTGIGGSDAPAIMGISPWRTPLEVYFEKIGLAPALEESEPMRWGNLLEPVIRAEYARRTGYTVRYEPNESLPHPKYAFMRASFDGLAFPREAPTRVLQCKASRSADAWGEPGTDEVPEVYNIQVQHEMAVAHSPVADIAVLIAGSDFRIYQVEADRELQEMLIEAEAMFWSRVQAREEPEADFNRASLREMLKRIHPQIHAPAVLASDADHHWRAVLTESNELERRYRDAADVAKAHLIHRMGEAPQLLFADGAVLRRKLIKRAGYAVEPSEYVDTRLVKPKGASE